ncbi:MAG: FtsX-like permease family protein [Pseudomonadota bacterium]
MSLAELFRTAYRYTLAAGRGHLSVFMSLVSISGLVLGTALLLTVLSVMNGFEREMRDRILALVPHATVHTAGNAAMDMDPRERLAALDATESVDAFVSFQAMAVAGREVMVVAGLGLENPPTTLTALVESQGIAAGQGMGAGLVLGDSVAARLGVKTGERVTLLVSSEGVYRSNAVKSRVFEVSAVVDSGTELDEALALLPMDVASELAGLQGGISGYHLRIENPFAIDDALPALRRALPPGSYATTWRMTHGNLYEAIQLSRDLVVLLVTSIIGVAAFNVVSALVLIVTDQRRPIAIMRTLGAAPRAMGVLFVLQGLIIGVIGTALGSLLGIGLCYVLPGLVATLESLLGFQLLSTDVYPVSFVPVDLRASDVLQITVIALVMCVLAALYPALRASRLEPAKVLHQDI